LYVYIPIIPNKLQKGEISFRLTDTLLCIKCQNKREVCKLTSLHYADIVDTEKPHYQTKLPTRKPTCVQDYNGFMGAVDNTDMVISTIEYIRESYKWYKKFVFDLLDVSIWNSYILYKYVSGKELHFVTFHLQLIKQIFEENARTINIYQGKEILTIHYASLKGTFQVYILISFRKKNHTRKCVVYSKHKSRRKSRYQCKVCDVSLCVDSCFRIYNI
jgi:hypothetical protein